MADELTPADIAPDRRWADDAERVIEAKADLKFVKAFAGLWISACRTSWWPTDSPARTRLASGQLLFGRDGKRPPDFRPSLDAPNPYSGMVFNDAVIPILPKGMPESLPRSIGQQDQEMSHLGVAQP